LAVALPGRSRYDGSRFACEARCPRMRAALCLSRAGEESWLDDPGTNQGGTPLKVVLPTAMKKGRKP